MAVTLQTPSATRLDVWPWAVIASAGWLVFAVGALGLFATGRLAAPRPLLAVALTLWILVVTVSAWNSPSSGGSLVTCLPTLGGLGLLWLMLNAGRDPNAFLAMRTAVDVAALAFIAVALFGWAQQALAAPSISALLQGRNPVPFGHSVYTAGAALLVGSWLASSAVASHGFARGWRAAGVAGALLAIMSSASRAGVAAAAVTGSLVAVMWWWRRGRRLRDAVIGGGVLLIVGAIGLSTNVRLRDFVVRGQWSALAAASNDHRLAMADAGRALGASHGLFGPGPGTVPLAYHAGNARVAHAPDGSLQVHSAPLQVWATTGPAGLLALAVLLAALTPAIARALRPSAAPDLQVLAAGVVGYGLFALTDHQFDLPFIAVLSVAHVAALLSAGPKATAGPPSLFLRAAVVVIGGLALAGPVWYRAHDLAARAAFATAAKAHDTGDARAVQDALATAGRRAPWDRYYTEVAAAWSWERDPEFARRLLETVVTSEKVWPSEFATYNLAWLALARGDAGEAAVHFADAARLAPHRTGVLLGRALALAALGNLDGAGDAFARQLLSEPRSITLSLWEQPALHERRPVILARIRELATTLAGRTDDPGLRTRLRETAIVLAWWWEPDGEQRRSLLAGLSPATRAPLEALVHAPARGTGPWEGSTQWGLLAETWATGHPAVAAPDPWKPALEARLAATRDFRAFVTAPPTEDVFRRAYRVGRGGYRVIMRHPASPEVFDFPVFEENLLLAPHLNALFPVRGWIPGSMWRALDPAGGATE